MNKFLEVAVQMNVFYLGLNAVSKAVASSVIFLLLSSCKHNPGDVEIIDVRPFTGGNEVYIVQKGDTLYSVAWHYNKDFKELADVNEIHEPYTIFPNQKIILSSNYLDNKTKKAKSKRSKSKYSVVVKKNTVDDVARIVHNSHAFVWRWPATGYIIQPFSLFGRVNKGIDIHGELGDPVFAAASGEVVYAGSDMVSYGKLIILKHSSRYLSAYAHNRELHVREGDLVKVNQEIAEIGVTAAMKPKLHFEIRRDGKPVNPVKYLPKR